MDCLENMDSRRHPLRHVRSMRGWIHIWMASVPAAVFPGLLREITGQPLDDANGYHYRLTTDGTDGHGSFL